MKHKKIAMVIKEGGIIEHIFDDKFNEQMVDKSEIKSIERASHVEPDKTNLGMWIVDLSPVKGPLFTGFKTREKALKSEVEWLNENYYILGEGVRNVQ